MHCKSCKLALVLLLAASLATPSHGVYACTSILVSKAATKDGSVLMATSCDGGIMGRVYVLPAKAYDKHAKVPMFYDFPAPSKWEEHLAQQERGSTLVGQLPVEQTYRCILAAGHLADSVTGGMNEHGVSMGIEYMGMKPELVSRKGVVSTCSNHWTTSLIANGLMRAKTAREAIRVMGSMAEQYGFTYYWGPTAGCAIPIVDEKEAWIMEIFGPGRDWSPGNGKPGAVWCARRVPDGHATCNANRSRIGEVDLGDTDHFMASSNIYSLAEQLGLWKPGTSFLWYEVYGVVGGRGNSLREWAGLNRLAPSLHLKATGDPAKDRYPFSVRPDKQIDVPTLTSIMRDYYQGTQFDVTEHPAFQVSGKKSPLARPFGSRGLFDLLGIKPERCIGSETSGYVYISQVRDWLPGPISGCMWFTHGPACTGCFTPIYSGTTEIPASWSRSPDFTRVDLSQFQWKCQLVENLVEIEYQEAIKNVQAVFEPAEEQFLTQQPDFEEAAVRVFQQHGAARATEFITEYTNACLENVDEAYGELVDTLMFKRLYSYPHVAPPKLPVVSVPTVSRLPERSNE